MTAKSNLAQKVPTDIALIVFGTDRAKKHHASRFGSAAAQSAQEAAKAMGMRALRVVSDEQREIARRLPKGNAAHISNQAGGSHGGESGLNLFVNDEKRVRWSDSHDSQAPRPNAAVKPRTVENAVDEIERLRQLLVDHHLTVGEFERLKANVLARL